MTKFKEALNAPQYMDTFEHADTIRLALRIAQAVTDELEDPKHIGTFRAMIEQMLVELKA